MHVAYMDTCACTHAEIAEHFVIGERIRDSGACVLEQQEEAIRTVNLTAPVRGQKITSSTIVPSPKLRGAVIPQPLYQLRAIDDVGEEQRAGGRRGVRCQATL
jgi:hypothetical protein